LIGVLELEERPPGMAAAAIGGPVGAACLRAAVVRSECYENKLSGTIGSWIGSMAKLTRL
jgi:hypothetical protein